MTLQSNGTRVAASCLPDPRRVPTSSLLSPLTRTGCRVQTATCSGVVCCSSQHIIDSQRRVSILFASAQLRNDDVFDRFLVRCFQFVVVVVEVDAKFRDLIDFWLWARVLSATASQQRYAQHFALTGKHLPNDVFWSQKSILSRRASERVATCKSIRNAKRYYSFCVQSTRYH